MKLFLLLLLLHLIQVFSEISWSLSHSDPQAAKVRNSGTTEATEERNEPVPQRYNSKQPRMIQETFWNDDSASPRRRWISNQPRSSKSPSRRCPSGCCPLIHLNLGPRVLIPGALMGSSLGSAGSSLGFAGSSLGPSWAHPWGLRAHLWGPQARPWGSGANPWGLRAHPRGPCGLIPVGRGLIPGVPGLVPRVPGLVPEPWRFHATTASPVPTTATWTRRSNVYLRL